MSEVDGLGPLPSTRGKLQFIDADDPDVKTDYGFTDCPCEDGKFLFYVYVDGVPLTTTVKSDVTARDLAKNLQASARYFKHRHEKWIELRKQTLDRLERWEKE